MNAALAAHVRDIVTEGGLPLVLGGDHSCAIGTWKGVSSALAGRGPVGLLWIDAHMDAHTPRTTPSGAYHGMPLACLLGHGEPSLTSIASGARLEPEHVCLVGVRSHEPGEAGLLERLGVRVFYMEEVARRGLREIMDEALAVVRTGTVGFGLSIDLDAIDPAEAPGVTTPAPGGLRAGELLQALEPVAHAQDLVALELAEYAPRNDPAGRTAELAIALVGRALGGRRDREAAARLVGLEYHHGTHHYDVHPLVITRAKGVHVWDDEGRRYIDMLSAYSALTHGHCNPRLVGVLARQARTLALTSRVVHNDRLPPFLARLCELTGQDMALPVNTGLEAVEAAVKIVRKWAHVVKGVAADAARIVACNGSFHGRSLTALAMSSEEQYREGFGPFPAGFVRIPFGDARALEEALTPDTAAFIVEPIQGEAGVIVPPEGYLAACRDICSRRGVLLVCDEVQTGLGRTGRMLASEHDGVKPDLVILGKALGGGLLPVSAVVRRRDVMEVLQPGDHGSTFGGNPLAAAVGLEALNILVEERLPDRAAELGQFFLQGLQRLASPLVREVRGRGLLIGVELDTARVDARTACRALLARGVLTKDTHGRVLRFAPPLVIERPQLEAALRVIERVFRELAKRSAAGR